jgi:hypothetical protein
VGAVGCESWAGATVIVKLDVVAVAEFASVTRIWIDRFWTVVGVPLMTPVEEFKVRPAGSVPLTKAKDRGVAPPEALIDRE